MFDITFCFVVNIALWAYVGYCLWGGKKIEYECRMASKTVIFAFFIICGILIFWRVGGLLGAFTLASFLLAAAIYHIIPSGLCDGGIIVSGRYFPFNKINEFHIEKKDNESIVTFMYKHRPHILIAEKEQYPFLKAYYDRYQQIGGKK